MQTEYELDSLLACYFVKRKGDVLFFSFSGHGVGIPRQHVRIRMIPVTGYTMDVASPRRSKKILMDTKRTA